MSATQTARRVKGARGKLVDPARSAKAKAAYAARIAKQTEQQQSPTATEATPTTNTASQQVAAVQTVADLQNQLANACAAAGIDPSTVPGTRAYIAANSQAAISLPDHYSNEAAAERTAKGIAEVQVVRDEWESSLMRGYDPLAETAQPFLDANPDKSYRWQSERIQKRMGDRGMTATIDPANGKTVHAANYTLYEQPRGRAEYLKRRVVELSQEAVGAIDRNFDVATGENQMRGLTGDSANGTVVEVRGNTGTTLRRNAR